MKALFAITLTVGLAFTGISGTTNGTDNVPQTQPESLVSRHYAINQTFWDNLKHLAGVKEGEDNLQMLIRYFKQNGIEIQNPEAMFFDRENLFVRATAANQNQIERLVVAIKNDVQPSKVR